MMYNLETTQIFFENEDKTIAICSPGRELPIEVVALRDLPPKTRYWIIDFSSEKYKDTIFPPLDFFEAYELDESVLGEPHGIALGYHEWAKLQSPGTPGL